MTLLFHLGTIIGTYMKLIEIQNKLINANLKLFSSVEFRRVMKASKISAKKLIERYVKKRVFVRFRRALYGLRMNLPSFYLIANNIYKPSYISFETALSYYNMIPEVVHTYTSATTKTTRNFEVEKQVFSYHKIKKTAFTGYKLLKIENEKVLFAEKEKALADYLYFIFLKRKSWNDRLNIKGIDRKKLNQYVVLFQNDKYTRWVKNAI